ncbi:dj-1 family protein [Colletotrichum incanum]|uniref:Dj-1 family protein n=1 Tax=Colletotrichum incanum TaxID=1573173 RepID=A0A166M1T5_COLIC|nr:dj-1 family protein [Colletotrichum incanum]OHW92220.1 DJ-1 family protein [Colletotrichum incanum]
MVPAQVFATLIALASSTVSEQVINVGIRANDPIDVSLLDRPLNITNNTLPNNYGIILFPTFQAPDVFGPLDILNMLSLWHSMNLSVIANTSDPVSTAFNSNISLGTAMSSFSQAIVPLHTFANPPLISMSLSCQCLYWGWTLSKSRSARRPKGNDQQASLANGRQHGPITYWVDSARWVVDDNIYTTSGVSAGIDRTLAYVEEVFGKARADDLALEIGYLRVSDSRNDPFTEIWDVTDVPPVAKKAVKTASGC